MIKTSAIRAKLKNYFHHFFFSDSMPVFIQEDFDSFAIENNVVQFSEKPIKLKSGKKSHLYFNWRNVTNDVYLTEKLSDYIISFANDVGLDYDCFYGVPESATKIGIATQIKFARKSYDYGKGSHCLPFGRVRMKRHGAPENRLFIGYPKGRSVIIEDVTTTGDSLAKEIRKFNEAGFPVEAAITLTDREELNRRGESAREVVENEGVLFYAMTKATEILPSASAKTQPNELIKKKIEKEYKKYGVRAISLI